MEARSSRARSVICRENTVLRGSDMTALNDGDGDIPRDVAGQVQRVEGAMEAQDSSVEDTPGAPSWPMPSTGTANEAAVPPVGLNWGVVAAQLGVERRVLEHEGQIVLPGEYFPEAGFFIDPGTFDARHVDVGDIALRSGYFLGDITISEFRVQLTIGPGAARRGKPIVVPQTGPIIGLFTTQLEADRAKRKIIQASLGSGIVTQPGPLGVELRVARPETSGGVATVIAAQGGAVLSVAGRTFGGSGPMATRSSASGNVGDSRRAGIGAFSGSEGPEVTSMDSTEVADGKEFSSL